jgi:hypothetical protein
MKGMGFSYAFTFIVACVTMLSTNSINVIKKLQKGYIILKHIVSLLHTQNKVAVN